MTPLKSWIAAHGTSRRWLADRLGVSYPTVRGLIEPDRQYPVPAAIFDLRDPLAGRVAELIGSTEEEVRRSYLAAA